MRFHVATRSAGGVWRVLQRQLSTATTPQSNPLPTALLTCLRVGHATEVDFFFSSEAVCKSCSQETVCSFMEGQEWALGGRVDAQHFHTLAAENLSQIDVMKRRYDASTSALLPLLRPVGFLCGAAVTWAPSSTRMAVYGALQDSISDEYNDHIRTLLEQESTHPTGTTKLKELFVKLRDEARVPDGAVPPPDLRELQKIEELSFSQGIGAVVKGTCRLSMHLLTKI